MPRPNRGTRLSDKPNARGHYEILWPIPARTPGGKGNTGRHSTGTGSRAEAERYFAGWLLARDEEVAARQQDRTPTLADCMKAYREGHVLENDLPNACWIAATHMVEASDLGKMLATELTPLAVKRYDQDRAEGKIGYVLDGKRRGYRKGKLNSAATRQELVCANSAMKWCVQNRIFGKGFTLADLTPIKVPEASAPKDHFLTVAEADALLAEAATLNRPGWFDPLYLFILIDLDTATRVTAVEELTWDRVKLGRDTDGQWWGQADFRVPGRRQTKKRRGVNDLSSGTARILAEARLASNHERVLGTETTINWRFRRLCKKVLGREEGPHILRHSWATWAIAEGVPPVDVADVLHDTVATVMKTYRHVIPERRVKAVNLVAGLRASGNGGRTE